MTQDQLRRTTGQRAHYSKSRITETRHWAFAEVLENTPIAMSGRSLLHLSNTDNGKVGWHDYGPET